MIADKQINGKRHNNQLLDYDILILDVINVNNQFNSICNLNFQLLFSSSHKDMYDLKEKPKPCLDA